MSDKMTPEQFQATDFQFLKIALCDSGARISVFTRASELLAHQEDEHQKFYTLSPIHPDMINIVKMIRELSELKEKNSELQQSYDLLCRKVEHGCANHSCPDCDSVAAAEVTETARFYVVDEDGKNYGPFKSEEEAERIAVMVDGNVRREIIESDTADDVDVDDQVDQPTGKQAVYYVTDKYGSKFGPYDNPDEAIEEAEALDGEVTKLYTGEDADDAGEGETADDNADPPTRKRYAYYVLNKRGYKYGPFDDYDEAVVKAKKVNGSIKYVHVSQLPVLQKDSESSEDPATEPDKQAHSSDGKVVHRYYVVCPEGVQRGPYDDQTEAQHIAQRLGGTVRTEQLTFHIPKQ